jgi:glycosyltransferase involved in cell wall biosynthesis
MRRLKVLVSAYACSPAHGSEPGVGWRFAEAISKHHDLWILTEKEKFQAGIERELDRRPSLRDRMRFHYIPKRRRRTLRKLWPPSYYWYYRRWQWAAYQRARRLHERVRFDVVHQLNMVGFREPGYLWKLDAPFVWGPVGGMVQFPWRLLRCAGPGLGVGALGYNFINAAHMRLLRRPRLAARRARSGLIAATSQMKERMLALWGTPSEVICEVGQTRDAAEVPSLRRPGMPLRLAWCGRHVPRKALGVLLKALAELNGRVDWRLDIIGDGPCSNGWKRRAAALGLQDRCRWHGAVPRAKAIAMLREAHLFVVTSLRDLTSTVVLESISQAVPVICLDHCGFADVVTPDCGVKIPPSTPQRVSTDIARTIEGLWHDEPRRRRLARGALRRGRQFAWAAKADAINAIYRRAIRAQAA